MRYQEAKTAKDIRGKTIRVGDKVRLEDFEEVNEVVRIHRQGYDGTILTLSGAPDPKYPHHVWCRACITVRV